MIGVDVLAAVGRIAYALQSSPVVAEVHELRAAVEKLIADRAELLEALQKIAARFDSAQFEGSIEWQTHQEARAAIVHATGEGNE